MVARTISSITFITYHGSAYAGNWSRIVPALMLPLGYETRFLFAARTGEEWAGLAWWTRRFAERPEVGTRASDV
jgi:hypothetical protein